METTEHQQRVISQFTLQAKPFAEHQAHSQRESFESIRDLAALTGVERVVDCCCGPGLVSCYLADYAQEVVGVDLTQAMIDQARASAAEKGLDRVSFQTGNAAALPFADGEFDVAVSRYAFHHLENPEAAFREMVRVTRPGGRIIVADVALPLAKRARYDAFEKRRDPSHTQALTLEELFYLGERAGLGEVTIRTYGVPMTVDSLIDSSFPDPADRTVLREMMQADVGVDELGFNARLEDGVCLLTFPIAVLAWTRPGV
jgi:ubiquinone/menaquinone biosynthesis C-methylase UbiE